MNILEKLTEALHNIDTNAELIRLLRFLVCSGADGLKENRELPPMIALMACEMYFEATSNTKTIDPTIIAYNMAEQIEQLNKELMKYEETKK
jgi:hypothetical protein